MFIPCLRRIRNIRIFWRENVFDNSINGPKFYDIKRVPGNGKLVLPLSMSRLHTGQSAKAIFEFIQFFLAKCETHSIDVILVYTNGLYCNSNEIAHTVRRRTVAQMMEHKRRILALLCKQKIISPTAIHFELMDNLILKDSSFIEKFVKLKKLYNENLLFQSLVDDMSVETATATVSDAGVDFILEETLVSYLIREKLVPLPQVLSNTEAWQLLCYPGSPVLADVYLYDASIFRTSQNGFIHSFDQKCRHSIYDISQRIVLNYDDIKSQLTNFLVKVLDLAI